MKRWFWQRVAYRLADGLVRLGVTRRQGLWKSVYLLSPRLAGMCALFEDSTRPENTLFWSWEQGDQEHDAESVDGLLAEISTMIERAPVPLGGDDYLIFVRQYKALPGETRGVSLADMDLAEETVPLRQLQYACNLHGNRWRDWKGGEGRTRLREALTRAEPTSQAPLAMIGVVVTGRASARVAMQLEGKRPAF